MRRARCMRVTLRLAICSRPVSSSDDAERAEGPPEVQIRVLAGLVVIEAFAMVAFVVIDVVAALREADAEWGAVWFVLVVMGLWAIGLLLVAKGVLAGSRWAFSPILYTQLLFGIAAI